MEFANDLHSTWTLSRKLITLDSNIIVSKDACQCLTSHSPQMEKYYSTENSSKYQISLPYLTGAFRKDEWTWSPPECFNSKSVPPEAKYASILAPFHFQGSLIHRALFRSRSWTYLGFLSEVQVLCQNGTISH